MRAAQLLEQGHSEAEVARRLGVHRQSVNRWVKTLDTAGRDGLRRAARAGRRPKLSAEELSGLEQCLKQDPKQFGYLTGLWTLPRVCRLIEQQYGIRYDPRRCSVSWASSTGAVSDRADKRGSAMKRLSGAGSNSAGLGLKKSPPRRAHHRLHRRKRTERAATPGAHKGATRADSGAAVSLQLEGYRPPPESPGGTSTSGSTPRRSGAFR